MAALARTKETIMCANCHATAVSRRRLVFGGAAALSLATVSRVRAEAPAKAPNAISGGEALKRIMEGNGRYAANLSRNKDLSAGRAARASAQYPIAAILSCADSRIAPELAFDQGPGELFVVRLASIEYGVKYLGIPLVVVLGHSNCGAVNAAIKFVKEGAELPGHLPELVNSIKPAVEAAIARKPTDLLADATAENVRLNAKRLATAAPVVDALVKDGKVKVVGGVYDIASGKVALLS
jgi:carbonic anhydrase